MQVSHSVFEQRVDAADGDAWDSCEAGNRNRTRVTSLGSFP